MADMDQTFDRTPCITHLQELWNEIFNLSETINKNLNKKWQAATILGIPFRSKAKYMELLEPIEMGSALGSL